MKRIFSFVLCPAFIICCMVACERKPYVEHKLSFEKIGDDCNKVKNSFSLNSNFGGERYEFDKCLPAGFSKEQLTTERHGDTVLVKFTISSSAPANTAFQLTLDIDSYPAYHFVTIGEDTYVISSAQK